MKHQLPTGCHLMEALVFMMRIGEVVLVALYTVPAVLMDA